MFDHSVGVFVTGHATLANHRRANMGKYVHARGIHPREERFVRLGLTSHEVYGSGSSFVVDRFHPLAVKRSGILDRLFADAAPMRLDGWIVGLARLGVEHAAR